MGGAKGKKRLNAQILLSPWAVLAGMALGSGVGILDKDLARTLSYYGKIYLSFLQMCVLPILLSAVASSLGKLMKDRDSKQYMKKMAVVLSLALITTSAFGLAAGLVGGPGHGLNKQTQGSMGDFITRSEQLEISFTGTTVKVEEPPKIVDFMMQAVPSNIFASLANAGNLQVLFFAVILGIALGKIQPKPSENFITFLDALYLALTKVIKWAMYLLPFGLLCLMADQVSRIGADSLFMMMKFIIIFYICCILAVIFNTVIIWKRSGVPLGRVMSALKEPVIVALATRNSLATLPSALQAMHEELKFDRTGVNLLLPLSVTLGRFGNVLYFALGTVFIAQLYNTSFGVQEIIITLAGSVLAGMATSGATGVLTLSMMLIVLEPLKLPFDAALVLFIAIDPIIDPIRTLLIVHSSCAVTALTAGIYQGERA